MMVSKRKTTKAHSRRVELRQISGCMVYLTQGKVLPAPVRCLQLSWDSHQPFPGLEGAARAAPKDTLPA